jgi:hypothetical protein
MGFDPAPFCAAPMPNQKRRLPIAWLPSQSPGGGRVWVPMASINSAVRRLAPVTHWGYVPRVPTMRASAASASRSAPIMRSELCGSLWRSRISGAIARRNTRVNALMAPLRCALRRVRDTYVRHPGCVTAAANLTKKSSAVFFAALLMRRWPSWASLPPICASTS